MRRLLLLALLPLAACASRAPLVLEESESARVSTSEIALGLLDASAPGCECRLDGEVVDVGEAARRIRGLAPGERVRLALAQGDAHVEMDVAEESRITASARWSWRSEVRTR